MQNNREADGFHAFKYVPKTGVIYVMSKAFARGYKASDPQWSNLGQGAPEVGQLPGGPQRLANIPIAQGQMEYGHIAGIPELRQAVADLYNHRFRQGLPSKYTMENVAISPGGRGGLVRATAALKHINIGHFIPDYTAYAEVLDTFRNLIPIPIILDKSDGFKLHPELLHKEVTGKGLEAVLFSNPSNPTGQIIFGDDLANCVDVMQEIDSTLIIDEFYSHYHYGAAGDAPAISSAAFVEDVNEQSVVIIDGLSKNWRYPGLRISWTVGPAKVIETIASTGSFFDGGASHPVQQAIVPLLAPDFANQEAKAIQDHFSKKRDIVIKRLKELGFVLHSIPEGSFYIFASLENMPRAIQDGFDFFYEALKRKVIVVPGVFFDVDPGHRRSHFPSPLSQYIRLSFGPSLEELTNGLDRIGAMITELQGQ